MAPQCSCSCSFKVRKHQAVREDNLDRGEMPKSSYFPHWDLDLLGSVWCVLAFQEFFWGAGGVYCDNLMLLENK